MRAKIGYNEIIPLFKTQGLTVSHYQGQFHGQIGRHQECIALRKCTGNRYRRGFTFYHSPTGDEKDSWKQATIKWHQ